MTNRTGMAMSEAQAKEVISEAQRIQPTSEGSILTLEKRRHDSIAHSLPVGTVPVPVTLKGLAKSALQKLIGRRPEVLIDKLGERLAFERVGVRLYDGLIAKCEAIGKSGFEKPLQSFRTFREQEARHFILLKEVMENLGADPTAVTPCADTSAVASTGIHQVIFDARTSLAQSIQSILMVEMTDNEGWELLIQLAEDLDLKSFAEGFRNALAEEAVHLEKIRSLYYEMILTDVRAA